MQLSYPVKSPGAIPVVSGVNEELMGLVFLQANDAAGQLSNSDAVAAGCPWFLCGMRGRKSDCRKGRVKP